MGPAIAAGTILACSAIGLGWFIHDHVVPAWQDRKAQEYLRTAPVHCDTVSQHAVVEAQALHIDNCPGLMRLEATEFTPWSGLQPAAPLTRIEVD